jgi:hypothetical protein
VRGPHELMSHGLFDALRALLADGEWHDLDSLVAQLGDRIPPEIASRRWLAGRHRSGARWPTAPAAVRRALARGRRYVVVGAIGSLDQSKLQGLRVTYERGPRRTILRVRAEPAAGGPT